MARIAEFGVFPVFQRLDGQLDVQPEIVFPSEEEARRAADVFANLLGGAVVFTRATDPEAGIVETGVIIGRYGVMDPDHRDDPRETEDGDHSDSRDAA